MNESALRLADATAGGGITRLEVGVMATDDTARILLLRRAPGTPHPALWELPNGLVHDGEPPEQTAERVLREQAGVAWDLADYVGHVDYPTAEGTVRHLVFTARVGTPDISLSLQHDGHAWRYADALPALRPHMLDLLRHIAPDKPMLDRDEWQDSLPRWHVGANALVRDQHDRILLVRPGRGSGRFQLPGGQVDAHETPPQAARRELREETGLDLPAGPLISISFEHPSPGWDHPTQIVLFDHGRVDSDTVQLTTDDPDIAEHRWAALAEAESLIGIARTERLQAGLLGLRQGFPALLTTTDTEII